MKNQVYTGTPTSRRFVACPSTVKSGDPVLIGKVPAVALNDYESATGGAVFLMNGTFTLSVTGATQKSPQVNAAMNPGDKVYAEGTLDVTTNVTTGLFLSATPGDTFFGNLDPTGPGVGSGLTVNANVILVIGS